MSRSIWKKNFISNFLLKSPTKHKKIWARNSAIPSSLVGSYVLIHNGKEFKKVFINKEKVGYKFGEFSFTRKYTVKKKPSKLLNSKKK